MKLSNFETKLILGFTMANFAYIYEYFQGRFGGFWHTKYVTYAVAIIACYLIGTGTLELIRLQLSIRRIIKGKNSKLP